MSRDVFSIARFSVFDADHAGVIGGGGACAGGFELPAIFVISAAAQ